MSLPKQEEMRPLITMYRRLVEALTLLKEGNIPLAREKLASASSNLADVSRRGLLDEDTIDWIRRNVSVLINLVSEIPIKIVKQPDGTVVIDIEDEEKWSSVIRKFSRFVDTLFYKVIASIKGGE